MAEARDECSLENVTVMKANRTGVAICLTLATLIVLGTVAALVVGGLPKAPPPGHHDSDGGAFLRVMFLFLCGSLGGAWFFSRISRRPSTLAGTLRATRNGIYVEGKRLVARREIKQAFVAPSSTGQTYVRIVRGGIAGSIDLQVKDVAEGRSLVRALGLDASQSSARYTIAAPSRAQMRKRILVGMFGGTLGFAGGIASLAAHATLGPFFTALLAAVSFCLYAGSIFSYVKSAAVHVGADGVLVEWLSTKRFIPIAEIAGAEVAFGDANAFGYTPLLVRVSLKSGENVDLVSSMGRGSGSFGVNATLANLIMMRAAIVAERINEAVAAAGKGSSRAEAAAWDPAILARGTRAIADWVASLRALHEKTETFREPGLLLDQLWGIVEDATKRAPDRVAAAVALAPQIDDEGRKRLRVAAQAAVVPKLRVALEAAASDDDDALVRALDAVDAP